MKSRELIKHMKNRGWALSLTKGNHLRFTFEPTGDVLFHSSTPSDRRGVKNLLARATRIEKAATA